MRMFFNEHIKKGKELVKIMKRGASNIGEVFLGLCFIKRKENRSYIEKYYVNKNFRTFEWSKYIITKLIEREA